MQTDWLAYLLLGLLLGLLFGALWRRLDRVGARVWQRVLAAQPLRRRIAAVIAYALLVDLTCMLVTSLMTRLDRPVFSWLVLAGLMVTWSVTFAVRVLWPLTEA